MSFKKLKNASRIKNIETTNSTNNMSLKDRTKLEENVIFGRKFDNRSDRADFKMADLQKLKK